MTPPTKRSYGLESLSGRKLIVPKGIDQKNELAPKLRNAIGLGFAGQCAYRGFLVGCGRGRSDP